MDSIKERKIQVGIRLPNSGPLADPRSIFQLARTSEALGFDSVWVHDHMTWARDRVSHYSTGAIEACKDQEPHFFESVTTAAAVGSVLDHAKVGIAGLAMPLRDPRVLAKQLGSLDTLLGGGRLIVAVGVGSQPEDFRVMRIPWKRRGRITNDYLAAVRDILNSDGPVDFNGDEVAFERGTFQPNGKGVELLVAASSSAGLLRVAKYGDGWMCGAAPLDRFIAARQELIAAVDGEGRDPSTVSTTYEAYACLKPTRDDAIETAGASVTALYGSLEDGLDRAIIGDAQSCLGRMMALVDAGVDVFELRLIGRSASELEDIATAISETILPGLRGLAPLRL